MLFLDKDTLSVLLNYIKPHDISQLAQANKIIHKNIETNPFLLDIFLAKKCLLPKFHKIINNIHWFQKCLKMSEYTDLTPIAFRLNDINDYYRQITIFYLFLKAVMEENKDHIIFYAKSYPLFKLSLSLAEYKFICCCLGAMEQLEIVWDLVELYIRLPRKGIKKQSIDSINFAEKTTHIIYKIHTMKYWTPTPLRKIPYSKKFGSDCIYYIQFPILSVIEHFSQNVFTWLTQDIKIKPLNEALSITL